jgi:hypothetical protein
MYVLYLAELPPTDSSARLLTRVRIRDFRKRVLHRHNRYLFTNACRSLFQVFAVLLICLCNESTTREGHKRRHQ